MTPNEKFDKTIVEQKDACIVSYTIREFDVNGVKTWGKLRVRRVNGEEFRTVEFPCEQLWALGCEHNLVFTDKKERVNGRLKTVRAAAGRIWCK